MGVISDKIRRAIFGGEVRDSIADGIEVVEQLREDYDRQVINAGNSNAEIVDARGGEAKLKDRLDNFDSHLEHITNTDDFFKNDVLLIPSYRTNKTNWTSEDNLRLYLSNDGINLYSTNLEKLFESGKTCFDYYADYIDDEFIFLCDFASGRVTGAYAGDSFNIIKSKDLINFTEESFHFDGFERHWAPKLFRHNNEIYIVCALQIPGVVSNFTNYKMDIYYSKALDNTLKKWSAPTLLNIPNRNDDMQYIDPFIVVKDNEFHLFVKREGIEGNEYQLIQHYKSSSLNGNFEFVQNIKTFERVEAPSIVSFNGKYLMYVDSHCDNRTSGRYLMLESTNLIDWSEPKALITPNNEVVRHFTPLVLNNNILKETVISYYKNVQVNTSIISNSLVKNNTNKLPEINLIRINLIALCNGSNIIDNLPLRKNYLYRINYDDNINNIIINSMDHSQLNDGDRFYFLVASSYKYLTIKKQGNIYLPFSSDFEIGFEYGNNEQIIEFVFKDNEIRCATTSSLAFKNTGYENYNIIDNSCLLNGKYGYVDTVGTTSVSDISMEGCRSLEINASGNSNNIYTGCKKYFYNPYKEGDKLEMSFWYLVRDISKLDDGFQLDVKATKDGSPVILKSSAYKIKPSESWHKEIIAGKWVKAKFTFELPSGSFSDYYINPCVIKNGNVLMTKFSLIKL